MAPKKKEEIMSPKMKIVMDALQKKFPDDKVKVRQGKGGMQFNYIPTQEIIDRLNDVFGCSWSAYEIDSKIFGGPDGKPTYISKRVCIEIPDPDNPDKTWRREGDGGHPVLGGMDLADVMKSAYSKAFTKAASNFGVGLYLWGVDVGDDNAPNGAGYPTPETTVSAPPPRSATAPPMSAGPSVTTVNPGAHNPPPNFNNPNAHVPPPTNRPMSGQDEFSYPNMGPNDVQQATAYIDSSGATAVTSGPQVPGGPPSPPTASLNVKTPHVQDTGSAPIQEFQVNAIGGFAGQLKRDPIEVIHTALGEAGKHIQDIKELTSDQAIEVFRYLKQQKQAPSN